MRQLPLDLALSCSNSLCVSFNNAHQICQKKNTRHLDPIPPCLPDFPHRRVALKRIQHKTLNKKTCPPWFPFLKPIPSSMGVSTFFLTLFYSSSCPVDTKISSLRFSIWHQSTCLLLLTSQPSSYLIAPLSHRSSIQSESVQFKLYLDLRPTAYLINSVSRCRS